MAVVKLSGAVWPTRGRPLRPLVTRRRCSRSALRRTCRPRTSLPTPLTTASLTCVSRVMSRERLAAFAEAFGTTVANPPSTPKIVITAEGVTGKLQTGPSSADDLVDQLRAAA